MKTCFLYIFEQCFTRREIRVKNYQTKWERIKLKITLRKQFWFKPKNWLTLSCNNTRVELLILFCFSWYSLDSLLLLLILFWFSLASLYTLLILFCFSWYSFDSLLLLLIWYFSWFNESTFKELRRNYQGDSVALESSERADVSHSEFCVRETFWSGLLVYPSKGTTYVLYSRC